MIQPDPVSAVVAEHAHRGQTRRANRRDLLLRDTELRIDGAHVRPILECHVDHFLLRGCGGSSKRDSESVSSIGASSGRFSARLRSSRERSRSFRANDQLGARGEELRLRTSHVECYANTGLELIVGNA
jgi:hypothetical protein